jgi:hypothetical protein
MTSPKNAARRLLVLASLLTACSDQVIDPEIPPPRPHDSRTFSVPAGQATFTALPGATAFHGTHTGIQGPASYRIEVPDAWNGVLVMFAHGHLGDISQLIVSDPPIRQHLIASGYAWGASSFSANYYDVRAGVEDTNGLALAFEQITGRAKPAKYYVTGRSMGGHIAAAAVEQETFSRARNVVRYAGAVPACGVMAENEFYDSLIAFNIAAHALAGLPIQSFPISDHEAKLPAIKGALWIDYDTDRSAVTAQGEKLRNLLMHLSGGPRPIFLESFPIHLDNLFLRGSSDGTWSGILAGSSANTTGVVYQLDADPALSNEEVAFNDQIFRVDGDFLTHNPLRPDGVRAIPILWGRFDVPVVTLFGLGDRLSVAMQRIYAERASASGSASRLVQRAIRAAVHCGFTLDEEIAAFEAMASWEQTGVVPAGDDVPHPATVADPSYGCVFTTATRPGLPAC